MPFKPGKRHFQRQRHARQLAARGDARERSERGALDGGDLERDALQPTRAGIVQRRRRDAELGVAELERDLRAVAPGDSFRLDVPGWFGA